MLDAAFTTHGQRCRARLQDAADAREQVLHDVAHAIYAATNAYRAALDAAIAEINPMGTAGLDHVDRLIVEAEQSAVEQLLRDEDEGTRGWIDRTLVQTWGPR